MTHGDFPHVRRAAAESLQGRLVLAVIRITTLAWNHSRLRSAVTSSRQVMAEASRVERLRLVALTIAVAAAVNVAGRLMMPIYSAPSIPIGVVLLVMLVASAAAAAPRAFVAARSGSWLGRLFRSETDQTSAV